MSGHRDSGFVSPAASGFGQRRRATADSPFCDVPEPSHRQEGHAVDPLRDGLSNTVDISASGSNGLRSSVSESQSVDMNRHGAGDAQVSAFTAVSYYPGAVDSELDFLPMSEVVNAVMEREERDPFQRGSSSGQGNAHARSSSPPPELYMSDSQMGDALGDLSAPEPEPASSGDVDMETIVQQLIRNTAIGQNVSTIEPDSDEGNNLIADYGSASAVLRDMSTPSTPRDDDPDDTRRFYLDDEDDIRYAERPNLRWGSELSDVDFDDFYRSFDDSGSHMTNAAVHSVADDANYASDGENGAVEEMNDDAHFLASAIQVTSMSPTSWYDEC